MSFANGVNIRRVMFGGSCSAGMREGVHAVIAAGTRRRTDGRGGARKGDMLMADRAPSGG